MRNECVKVLVVCSLVGWGLTASGCGFSEEYRKATLFIENAHREKLAREARDRAMQASLDYEGGLNYFAGRRVAQDRTKGVALFRKAADGGNANAQFALGMAYLKGQGISEDVAKGATWIQKSAEQGHLLGQRNLAVMYETGLGVPKDLGTALIWRRKAEEQQAKIEQANAATMRFLGLVFGVVAINSLAGGGYSDINIDKERVENEETARINARNIEIQEKERLRREAQEKEQLQGFWDR